MNALVVRFAEDSIGILAVCPAMEHLMVELIYPELGFNVIRIIFHLLAIHGNTAKMKLVFVVAHK